MRIWVAVVGGALLTIAPGIAVACQDGYYESCETLIGKVCVCLPNSGTVAKALPAPVVEVFASTAGTGLENWLQGSRNSAIGSSQPIPTEIRQELAGYIEEDILNRVRFKVGDTGVFNAGGITLQYGGVNGDVSAVTLIDVIVFKNAEDAYHNPSLWAHELTHVKQFRDGGVHSFAVNYVRDSHVIEDPAYHVGDGYAAWHARSVTAGGARTQFSSVVSYQRTGSTMRGQFARGGNGVWTETGVDLQQPRPWQQVSTDGAEPIWLKSGSAYILIDRTRGKIFYTDPGWPSFPNAQPLDDIIQ